METWRKFIGNVLEKLWTHILNELLLIVLKSLIASVRKASDATKLRHKHFSWAFHRSIITVFQRQPKNKTNKNHCFLLVYYFSLLKNVV